MSDNDNTRIERHSSRFMSSSLRPNCLQHILEWPEHNCVQIMCNTLSTYHVQHVVCHVVRRDSSVIKSDKVLSCIYYSFVLLAEPFGNEGGEETRVWGQNP